MNGWGAAALGLSCGGYMLAFARVFGGWLAPLTALCALGLFLYCGALAGLLEAAAAAALAGGVACLAVCLAQKRPRWGPARLGAVCFAAGCVPFLWQAAGMELTHYDNFSHWALVVKYLLCAGALPGADAVLVPFRDYPRTAPPPAPGCCAAWGAAWTFSPAWWSGPRNSGPTADWSGSTAFARSPAGSAA